MYVSEYKCFRMVKDNNFSGYGIVEEYNLHKKRKDERREK
jgi:hypothetical protein